MQNRLFRRLAAHEVTRKMATKAHWQISWVSLTHEPIAKVFVWMQWYLNFAILIFAVRACSWLTRENASRRVVEQKGNRMFGQNFIHKIIKTLSKTDKILKIFLGLIIKQLSIHITFECVQSHKWNKHSLNIRLVCCVCGSSMN